MESDDIVKLLNISCYYTEIIRVDKYPLNNEYDILTYLCKKYSVDVIFNYLERVKVLKNCCNTIKFDRQIMEIVCGETSSTIVNIVKIIGKSYCITNSYHELPLLNECDVKPAILFLSETDNNVCQIIEILVRYKQSWFECISLLQNVKSVNVYLLLNKIIKKNIDKLIHINKNTLYNIYLKQDFIGSRIDYYLRIVVGYYKFKDTYLKNALCIFLEKFYISHSILKSTKLKTQYKFVNKFISMDMMNNAVQIADILDKEQFDNSLQLSMELLSTFINKSMYCLIPSVKHIINLYMK